jgi:hypothetical protein
MWNIMRKCENLLIYGSFGIALTMTLLQARVGC